MAATVDDLVPITSDYTFIADNITSNGTVGLSKNNLYEEGYIFANTGNSVATNKGKSTIDGVTHLNSLRLKNTQDQLVFKVGGHCKVKFYTQSHSERGIQVGSKAGGTEFGTQDVNTTEFEVEIPSESVVYLSSFGGDFFFAGFEVYFEQTVTFTNDAGWAAVFAYVWKDDEKFAGEWPGTQLTANGEGKFTFSVLAKPTNIIFNDGGTNKTDDLEFKNGGKYNSKGREIELNHYTATFTTDFDEVYAYVWKGDVKALGDWPGTPLTATDGIYNVAFDAEEAPDYIIFHNNAGIQTDDLEFVDGQAYEYKKQDFTVTISTDMGDVYAWAWNGSGSSAENLCGEWPGEKLTGTDGVYTYTYNGYKAPESILFHNNAGTQTEDLAFENGKAYTYNKQNFTVTFQTNADWTNVYAWAWNGSGETAENLCGEWPGQVLEASEGVYTYTYNGYKAPESILFNGGDDSKKTPDMVFVNNKNYKYSVNATPYVLYALKENDSFTSGQTVDVKDADGYDVATITYGEAGGAAFGKASAGYGSVEGTSFKYVTTGNGTNGDQKGGTFYTITPTHNGIISVAVRLNGGKKFYILENGTALEGFNGITISEVSNLIYDFNVVAGKSYKVYCAGSKLGFFGFEFKNTDAVIGSTEWATYSNTLAVDLTSVEGLTAYMVTGVEGNAVVLQEVKDLIPANTGLLLNGAKGTFNIPTAKTESALNTSANLLKAGAGNKIAKADGFDRYVLSTDNGNENGKAAFRIIDENNATIPVGKAYLEVPVGGGARTLYINAETTGINNVEHAGQFTFGTVYNMAGQRVAQPTKGLYIMNGKKVVVK